jgi:hypothetical protein
MTPPPCMHACLLDVTGSDAQARHPQARAYAQALKAPGVHRAAVFVVVPCIQTAGVLGLGFFGPIQPRLQLARRLHCYESEPRCNPTPPAGCQSHSHSLSELFLLCDCYAITALSQAESLEQSCWSVQEPTKGRTLNEGIWRSGCL